jgi:hypothetical protein
MTDLRIDPFTAISVRLLDLSEPTLDREDVQ